MTLDARSAQVLRTEWRRKVLACVGGPEWLTEQCRVWDNNEKLIGPAHLNPPSVIRAQLERA